MNGDNVVIIVEGGVVQSVYSDNANVQAIVIDLDDKKAGGDFRMARDTV
jgi:hypothetical protein